MLYSRFTRTLLDSNQLQFRSTKALLKHMREVGIGLDVELSSHQLQKTGSNLFAVLVYQAVRLYFEFSSLQLSYL